MIEVKVGDWQRKGSQVLLYKDEPYKINFKISEEKTRPAALKSCIAELKRLIKVCEAEIKAGKK